MYYDSKQVFDVITLGKRQAGKRLTIDVTAACEVYRNFDIIRVGLICREDMPADALSKPKYNGTLLKLLTSGVDQTPVEERILCMNIERTQN